MSLQPPARDAKWEERVAELFEQAAEVPRVEREAFLRKACRGDDALHAELLSLLDAHDEAPDYLDRLVGEGLGGALAAWARGRAEELRPGQRVGHYAIREPLGAGAMGVVYRAYDPRLDRFVALKFLPAHLASETGARQRLMREARVASSLDHPNICTVYDVGELDDGRVFLALACYEGETLKQRIARSPVPVHEAVGLVRQVADGLSAAHRHGIIHCDIKPSNVIVTARGVAKILDFGIATARNVDAEDDGARRGTVAYMSPEQTRGEPLDARTDLWSLGVVLYELLTGRRPFEGPTDRIILHAIRETDPVPIGRLRPEVPPELEGLVETCLRKDPARRHQRAYEVLAGLRAIEAGDAVSHDSLAPVQRLAVLPLAGLTTGAEDAYLADGVTEDLVVRLSMLGGLGVIALASTRSFEEARRSPTEVGRELGAESVLQGSVGRSGTELLLRLQLLDVISGRPLLEREQALSLADLQGVLHDVAARVAGELRVQLRAGERRRLARQGSDSPEAYALYLKGRYFWQKRDRQSVQQAREHFQEALDLDPLFAQAWTGLADTYSVLGSYSALPPQDAFPRARAAAERALALDDELAEAHASLASTLADYYWDWEGAGHHFRRAIALSPSYATARLWYAGYLRDLGRFEDALAEGRVARELDPLSLPTMAAEGITLYLMDRCEEAVALFRDILAHSPSFGYAFFPMALALARQGKHREALEALKEAGRWGGAVGDVMGLSGYLYAVVGQESEARRIIAEWDAPGFQHYVSPFHRAVVHVGLGETNRALDLLQQACDERSKQARLLRVEPMLEPLRAEPRFQALLHQVGLTDDGVEQAKG